MITKNFKWNSYVPGPKPQKMHKKGNIFFPITSEEI